MDLIVLNVLRPLFCALTLAKLGRKCHGKGSKHRRRTGYGIQAEKAIKILFRDNINYGAIRTGEVRATRAAYPDISRHFEAFTDAQIKVWALIKK